MKMEQARRLGDIIAQVINQMQLQEPLRRIEIYKAWDKVVGDHVAGLTTNKYFTNGI